MYCPNMQERGLFARKQLYTTVFAQVFSPCGRFLAAGNNYGYVAIFSLTAALSPDIIDSSWKPFFIFKANTVGPVYSMTSTDKVLICGSDGCINAWQWSDLLNKATKLVWSLQIPAKHSFSYAEVNSMVIDFTDGSNKLYAGCGDNNIYVFDLESENLKKKLSGHTDYIHCVVLRNQLDCVSASEDGSIRVWDCRTPDEAVHIVEPYKNELCCRPEYGRWLGCVAVDSCEDWLVCGGGPKLSLWHMRSLSSTTVFETPSSCQKHAMFYEDTIISAGSEPFVNHWFVNGDLKAKIPCSPSSVLNISINANSESNKVLSVIGNSAKIDICTNFSYKAFSLTFVCS